MVSENVAPTTTDDGTQLCGSCRAHGYCRLGVGEFQLDASITRAPVVCVEAFHAGPNVAHGGWTAAMFDDVMGRAVAQRGLRAVTGSLTVDFLKPVPVETPLTVEVVIEGREGRKVAVTAVLRLTRDDMMLAKARGTWVERRQDHFERHEASMEAYRRRVGGEAQSESGEIGPGRSAD